MTVALVVILSFLSVCVAAPPRTVPGHYWRDYTGKTPCDALSAGEDNDGNTVYVGQVLKDTCLIPGQINATAGIISFGVSYYSQQTKDNIKILCTVHPEEYRWIFTKSAKFPSLDEKSLVLGGFQSGYKTYIGRLSFYDEVYVGKILVRYPYQENWKSSLSIVKDGALISFDSFEVLSYVPGTNRK